MSSDDIEFHSDEEELMAQEISKTPEREQLNSHNTSKLPNRQYTVNLQDIEILQEYFTTEINSAQKKVIQAHKDLESLKGKMRRKLNKLKTNSKVEKNSYSKNNHGRSQIRSLTNLSGSASAKMFNEAGPSTLKPNQTLNKTLNNQTRMQQNESMDISYANGSYSFPDIRNHFLTFKDDDIERKNQVHTQTKSPSIQNVNGHNSNVLIQRYNDDTTWTLRYEEGDGDTIRELYKSAGIFVNKNEHANVLRNAKNSLEMVKKLTDIVFNEEALKSCTRTGKHTGKPCLHQPALDCIINYVKRRAQQYRWDPMDDKDLNRAITERLAYWNKLY